MLRTGRLCLSSMLRRQFATAKGPLEVTKVPLDEPLPGFEKWTADSSTAPSSSGSAFSSRVSQLETGLRVATQPCHGEFVTIGVAIESGSRYEAEYTKGTSHLLEKLAFGETTKRSVDEFFTIMDQSQAIVDCQITKDLTIYAASCHRSGVAAILELLADSALRPKLNDEEVEVARQVLQHEENDMRTRIESIEPIVTDYLHSAAFRGNTLGFSRFTPIENIPKISRKELFAFLRAHHNPARMVVAGVGVDHEEFSSLVQRHFVPVETNGTNRPIDSSISQYTGGEQRMEWDLSVVGQGTPYPLLAHVVLGFQSCGYKDEDFVPFSVLQSLLGGGNSFSAGGPGKGMYTRMYTDVLNHHHWMYGCTTYNHTYADNGVFALHASGPPKSIDVALSIVLHQFLRLPEGFDQDEFNRAKAQLKSQLLMNLETRPVMFEDLARQVIGHGRRKLPEEYMAEIDKVQPKDLVRVAERMLHSRPSLVGYGKLDQLQSYEKLDDAVGKRDLALLKKRAPYFSFKK